MENFGVISPMPFLQYMMRRRCNSFYAFEGHKRKSQMGNTNLPPQLYLTKAIVSQKSIFSSVAGISQIIDNVEHQDRKYEHLKI